MVATDKAQPTIKVGRRSPLAGVPVSRLPNRR